MKILIDMNLSPEWVTVFKENNIKAVHWSDVGEPDVPDRKILEYARSTTPKGFVEQLTKSPEL